MSDGRGQPLGLSSSSQHNLQPAAATSAAAGARERASSAPREWEYVDIPKLHAGMQEAFTRICPMVTRNPLHRYHYMRMLAVLIGLSGTDFSRGLPHVGPGVGFHLRSYCYLDIIVTSLHAGIKWNMLIVFTLSSF